MRIDRFAFDVALADRSYSYKKFADSCGLPLSELERYLGGADCPPEIVGAFAARLECSAARITGARRD